MFSTVLFKVVTDFTLFKLFEAVEYLASDGKRYRLPVGAGSDVASTPPATWGPPLFLTPCGWYGPAVYGHDCGYQNTLEVWQDGGWRLAALSKADCDALCLEMMKSLKPVRTLLEEAQMRAIYDGVSFGGWHAFKEDRK